MQHPNTPKETSGSTRTYTDASAYLVNKRNVLPEPGEYINALSLPLHAHNEEIYINVFSANATKGIGGGNSIFTEILQKYGLYSSITGAEYC